MPEGIRVSLRRPLHLRVFAFHCIRYDPDCRLDTLFAPAGSSKSGIGRIIPKRDVVTPYGVVSELMKVELPA